MRLIERGNTMSKEQSVLARVTKAAVEGKEILPDDIHAISFDGFVSGFQAGLEEGYKRGKEDDTFIFEKKDIGSAIDLIVGDDSVLEPTKYTVEDVQVDEKKQMDLEIFCKEKQDDHSLYVTRIKKCRVKEISKEPGKRMEFILEDGPYDEYCKDRIASISFLSAEEEVNELSKCGFGPIEIDRIYREPKNTFNLVGVFIDVSYRVSKCSLHKGEANEKAL